MDQVRVINIVKNAIRVNLIGHVINHPYVSGHLGQINLFRKVILKKIVYIT